MRQETIMETVFKRLIVNVNFFVQIILFAYSSNGLRHNKFSFFFYYVFLNPLGVIPLNINENE